MSLLHVIKSLNKYKKPTYVSQNQIISALFFCNVV